MNHFLLVLGIALAAAILTYLGAPAAERFEVPTGMVSAALQFASGIIMALVAFSLMPPAVLNGSLLTILLAFFVGGALFVLIEYASARRGTVEASHQGLSALYIGILVDLMVDGMVIGVGSSLTLQTGLLLALGMACSTAPLAFVTIATARRQGMPVKRRRLLGRLFFVCIIAGALAGYLLLGSLPLSFRLTLFALASGFLITTVTQAMIPEANREGEPSFAGILFVAGISLYALFALVI
jgi:ZIP family zinc transporter